MIQRKTPLKRSRMNPVSQKKKARFLHDSPVHISADGREQCNLYTAAGKAEYQRRKWAMRKRQNNQCCLFGHNPACPGYMTKAETSFEHENGRTSGHRDDRISLPDGQWLNGAAHLLCNQWKGSRKIAYNSRNFGF